MSAVWGICGVGGISNDFALALSHIKANIGAVAASDASRAQKFAADFGVAKSYGSYEELAQDSSITVVYVGTVHTKHLEHASMFLRAGKHVLCEKPMGINEEEVREMVDLAKSKGVFFMEAFWTRCFPVIQKVRELLTSGSLGAPHAMSGEFGFVAPSDPSHRLWTKSTAGGGLLDIGCYLLQAAIAVYGCEAVPEIQAVGALTPEGVDKRASISLNYPSGVASLTYFLDANSTDDLKIFCEKGIIIIEGPSHCPTRARIIRSESRTSTTTEVIEESLPVYPSEASYCGGRKVTYPQSEGLVYEAQEVQRCLEAKLLESPVFVHAESLALVRISDAIRKKLGVVFDADARKQDS
jgi:dihydrodiol dehydrogenase / D-xylose 1-dehydrogenase (NADP)